MRIHSSFLLMSLYAVLSVNAGNVIHNGSFELGLTKDCWGKVFSADYISSENPYHGKRCLYARGLNHQPLFTKFYELTSGRYRVSFAYRSNNGSKIAFSIQDADQKRVLNTSISCEKNWKVFEKEMALDKGAYALFFWGKDWSIDAVTLSEAGVTRTKEEYLPPVQVEWGMRTEVLANVFYSGKPVEITFCAFNYGKDSMEACVSYDIVDIYGKRIYEGNLSLESVPANSSREMTHTIQNHPHGIFSLVYIMKDSGYTGELIYSVIPKVDGKCALGMLTDSDEVHLSHLARANIKWYSSLTDSIFRGYYVTPEKGEFRWYDENVALINKYMDNGIGHLCHNGGTCPAWYASEMVSKKLSRPFVGRGAYKTESRVLPKEVWMDIVSNIVGHYKGKIDRWYIDDEIDCSVSPEEWSQVMKHAHIAAKNANPNAILSTGANLEFYEELTDLGYGDCFDAIQGSPGNGWWCLKKTGMFVKKHGKELWTYIHMRGDTFYRTHQKVPWSSHVTHAVLAYKTTAKLILVSHATAIAPYRTEFGDCFTERHVFDQSMLDYDGSVKPNGIGYIMAGSLLAGAEPVDEMMLKDKGMTIMGFVGRTGCPSILAYGSGVLRIDCPPDQISIHDWFGNPMEKKIDNNNLILDLSELPVYVKSSDRTQPHTFFASIKKSFDAVEIPDQPFYGFTASRDDEAVLSSITPDGSITVVENVRLPPNSSIEYRKHGDQRLWLMKSYAAPADFRCDGDTKEYAALPMGGGIYTTIWGWGHPYSREAAHVLDGGHHIAYNNNQDYKVYINSCWNKDALVFAFDISDDQLIEGKDCVEIHIQTDWPKAAFRKPKVVAISLSRKGAVGKLITPEGSTTEIKCEMKPSENGYSIEVAIPLSEFGISSIKRGNVIGLDFYFTDTDSEDGEETTRYRWAASSGKMGQMILQ